MIAKTNLSPGAPGGRRADCGQLCPPCAWMSWAFHVPEWSTRVKKKLMGYVPLRHKIFAPDCACVSLPCRGSDRRHEMNRSMYPFMFSAWLWWRRCKPCSLQAPRTRLSTVGSQKILTVPSAYSGSMFQLAARMQKRQRLRTESTPILQCLN